MSRIAIIGTGLVGRAWAISYARAGHDVVLWDAVPEAVPLAIDYINGVLADLLTNGLLRGLEPAEVRGHIHTAETLEAALKGVDHVQENTPENLNQKRAIFAQLDELAPEGAVIASSSSAILPSKFTEDLKGRARCMVVHPINPPYLVPAAEVVPAPWTDQAMVDRTRDLLISAGHAPIVMKKELDGFVMNRLQGALLEEAFRLVADGYASVEDVDIGIREGLALRWSFMGPFETIDLNAPGGVRDYAARYQGVYEILLPSQQRRVDWTGEVMDEVEGYRRKELPADKLAERQVWRDRRLMALAAHKRQTDDDLGK